jgi:hypothetical protein
MLPFIAVEPKKEDIPKLEQRPQTQKPYRGPELHPARQAEILLKPRRREV